MRAQPPIGDDTRAFIAARIKQHRSSLVRQPLTQAAARRYIAEVHRHNLPPVADIFRLGVMLDGELVGVAMAGRPVARELQDGYTVEVLRVGTDGARNACSMLYGSCATAARALGYRRVVTYTLASEPGSSLLASGFTAVAEVPARDTWDGGARHRTQTDLFGNDLRPVEAKIRWERAL